MREIKVRSVSAENLRRVDQVGVNIVLAPDVENEAEIDARNLYDALYWALPSTTFETLGLMFDARTKDDIS